MATSPPSAPILPDQRGARAWIALLVGLAIDVGGSIVLSMVLGFGFYLLHNTLQTNATQMTPQARGTAIGIF